MYIQPYVYIQIISFVLICHYTRKNNKVCCSEKKKSIFSIKLTIIHCKNKYVLFLTSNVTYDHSIKNISAVCTSHKFHKLKYIKQDDIPTRSKIQQLLGTSLAQILFEYSHHEMIKMLDPIRSAGFLQQSCYKVQNDQLKMDIIQMIPEKQDILKSNIHHDILALGEEELKKFQAELETLTQSKLRNEFAEVCRMLEAEKRFAIRCNADEIHSRYEEYFKSTQQELEEQSQIESADVNAKHKKELQKIAVKTRIDTTHDVLRKLRPQIYYIIKSLYDDLELSYRAQREKIIADFNKIMRYPNICFASFKKFSCNIIKCMLLNLTFLYTQRKQQHKLDMRIRDIEKKKIRELHIQHYELKIQNVMNIIYVLCMERLRSSFQMHAVHKHCEEKVKSLYELIAKQDDTIKTMKKRITEYHDKNIMLQEKIIAITKEYQKFINFAFDAMPEHADFLLSLDLFSINKKDSKREKRYKLRSFRKL